MLHLKNHGKTGYVPFVQKWLRAQKVVDLSECTQTLPAGDTDTAGCLGGDEQVAGEWE